jgi:hypothetical protein
MKKLVLVIIIIWVGIGSVNAGGGFNYKKHYKRSHRVKVMNKIFNSNNCRGYNVRNGL